MKKEKKDINFKQKINISNSIQLSLTPQEVKDQIIEFVWFFNGSNNLIFLLENNNYNYVDLLFKKYCDEIEKLIIYYDLKEIIEESEFCHGWFKNWKNLEKFNKQEFTNKLKTDIEFSSVWSDFGFSDSLEFRNWGVQINFDNEDRGKISQKGKDQFRELINSLANDPENGTHIINYYNITNIEERLVKNNLLYNKFYCEPLSYKERIEWFFVNHYETGMELEIIMESMKDKNLDFYSWYDGHVSIPKFKLNIVADYIKLENNNQTDKEILFNYLFLLYVSKLFNMLPNSIELNVLYKTKERLDKKKLQNYTIEIGDKKFDSLGLKIADYIIK